jgi:sulfite exporter TauE/SafE
MALVGGLVLGLSTKFAASHNDLAVRQKFIPHIFFGLGRIISFTILGGLLGVLGSVLKFSSTVNGLMIILVGLVMIAMGLQLINIFPRFSNFKITLPKSIAKSLGISKTKNDYSSSGAMILGALTFFLPCGFTQAIQLYAISTGSFWLGGLAMGLFALGTAPGLLSIGGITSVISGSFKERFFKAAGLAVIFFGLFNLGNGYTLASLEFEGEIKPETQTISDPNVVLKNGVQIVTMAETNRGYRPNSFTIKKGIPVRWVINAQAPYSCATALIVPKYKIRAFLKAGENIVEFTPNEIGTIPFSCSMGMYTGVFKVVN